MNRTMFISLLESCVFSPILEGHFFIYLFFIIIIISQAFPYNILHAVGTIYNKNVLLSALAVF
jgi:Ni/Fe-hydrogenase subunit HybB-like protein